MKIIDLDNLERGDQSGKTYTNGNQDLESSEK